MKMQDYYRMESEEQRGYIRHPDCIREDGIRRNEHADMIERQREHLREMERINLHHNTWTVVVMAICVVVALAAQIATVFVIQWIKA